MLTFTTAIITGWAPSITNDTDYAPYLLPCNDIRMRIQNPQVEKGCFLQEFCALSHHTEHNAPMWIYCRMAFWVGCKGSNMMAFTFVRGLGSCGNASSVNRRRPCSTLHQHYSATHWLWDCNVVHGKCHCFTTRWWDCIRPAIIPHTGVIFLFVNCGRAKSRRNQGENDNKGDVFEITQQARSGPMTSWLGPNQD